MPVGSERQKNSKVRCPVESWHYVGWYVSPLPRYTRECGYLRTSTNEVSLNRASIIRLIIGTGAMGYDDSFNAAQTLSTIAYDGGRNEAQTRFDIIDRILEDCFGWHHDEIKVEEPNGPEYCDYVLGSPRKMIYEAKREGKLFEVPPKNNKNIYSLKQVTKLSTTNKEALRQVQQYCANRGVTYAAICNGQQIIAFIGSRQDGVDPLEGQCIIIQSLEHLAKEFHFFHNLLSKSSIVENKLLNYLNSGGSLSVPTKLSTTLPAYPDIKERSDFQASLKIIADLVLEDVLTESAIEQAFYENCYCEAGALSQYALLSKKILGHRYASLFAPEENNPTLQPITGGKKKSVSLSDEVIAIAASKRPIVLIGDVGVGKTSFIKHLIFVSAKEEFKDAIFIYIDLGRQASLHDSIKGFVLDEIERQLNDTHNIDLLESSFITGVYHAEVQRFRKGLDGELEESDPLAFKAALRAHLKELAGKKVDHLKKSINHLTKARKKQVVIAIDNADQRNTNTQQEAFIISEEIASTWGAMVFIAVRPQTFYQSKRSGALSAYPTKAFTIPPPRIDLVLEKRLLFALGMARGKTQIEKLKNTYIDMGSLALFLEALLFTFKHNEEITTLIDNISNGNVRTGVELVVKYIGSANADSERIIKEMDTGQKYIIPIHDFEKTIILGEYANYYPERSLAFNLFEVSHPDPKEHFLASIIIAFLNSNDSAKNAEGFINTGVLFETLQDLGFSEKQIENKLRRLTNKKLIETTERITFEEDITGLIGNMPEAFRATTTGMYHAHYWSANFSYMDAMVLDTPIFDRESREEILSLVRANDLFKRYERAIKFRQYISNCWQRSNINTEYYNWTEMVRSCKGSFEKVSYFLDKNGR
jgi:hypothetical protein